MFKWLKRKINLHAIKINVFCHTVIITSLILVAIKESTTGILFCGLVEGFIFAISVGFLHFNETMDKMNTDWSKEYKQLAELANKTIDDYENLYKLYVNLNKEVAMLESSEPIITVAIVLSYDGYLNGTRDEKIKILTQKFRELEPYLIEAGGEIDYRTISLLGQSVQAFVFNDAIIKLSDNLSSLGFRVEVLTENKRVVLN